MILVLGGKGKTGRKVVERLTTRGKSVRIGSRNEAPPFDWDAPETWAAAIAGTDTVYITFQPDLAVPGAREAVEAFTSQAVSGGIRLSQGVLVWPLVAFEDRLRHPRH